MYREGLLILAIVLLVIGGLLWALAPIGIVASIGYWIMIIGAIVLIIWIVLIVLNTIRSGA